MFWNCFIYACHINCYFRYYYILARLQRTGYSNTEEAMDMLRTAMDLARSAATNPLYLERRPGKDGAIQLSLQEARYEITITLTLKMLKSHSSLI